MDQFFMFARVYGPAVIVVVGCVNLYIWYLWENE